MTRYREAIFYDEGGETVDCDAPSLQTSKVRTDGTLRTLIYSINWRCPGHCMRVGPDSSLPRNVCIRPGRFIKPNPNLCSASSLLSLPPLVKGWKENYFPKTQLTHTADKPCAKLSVYSDGIIQILQCFIFSPEVDGQDMYPTISIQPAQKLGKLAAHILCNYYPEKQPFCLRLCAYMDGWKT